MLLLCLILGTADICVWLADLGEVGALSSLRLIHARLERHLILLQLIEAGLRAQRLRANLRGPLAEDDALLAIDLLQVVVLGLVGERAARHLSPI